MKDQLIKPHQPIDPIQAARSPIREQVVPHLLSTSGHHPLGSSQLVGTAAGRAGYNAEWRSIWGYA
jgi:hypothetical protein